MTPITPAQQATQEPAYPTMFYSFRQQDQAVSFANLIKSRGRASGEPYQATVDRRTLTVTVNQVPKNVLEGIVSKSQYQPQKSWTA